jgi:hypothetical protein
LGFERAVHDPGDIPDDDAGFTTWYRAHARRFFGNEQDGFADLVDGHQLEHKRTGSTGSVAFDALATDGCSNYLKASIDPTRGWRVEEFAARSYGKESKSILKDWMVRTYSTDELTEIAPLTEDHVLLKHEEAMRKAGQALKAGIEAVYVPLGLKSTRVANYKAIKASAFLFRTPEQRQAIVKQIKTFERRTGCGLELLTLRRTYADRRRGSLNDLAGEIEEAIRSGKHDLVKRLNMNRINELLAEISEDRLGELAARRKAARDTLFREINKSRANLSRIGTGRILTAGGRTADPQPVALVPN